MRKTHMQNRQEIGMDQESRLELLSLLSEQLRQAGKDPQARIGALLGFCGWIMGAQAMVVWHRQDKPVVNHRWQVPSELSEELLERNLLSLSSRGKGETRGAEGLPYGFSVSHPVQLGAGVPGRLEALFRDEIEPGNVHREALELTSLLVETLELNTSEEIRKALLESQTRYQALLDANPDLMFIFSEDGIYLDYRVIDKSMMVAEPEEMLGKSVFDLLPRHLAEKTIEAINHVRTTGTVYIHEYSLELEETRYFEARFVPCGTNRYLSIIRDITRQKQDALRRGESEEKYRRIYETANEGIMAFDEEHHIIQVNNSFCRMIGYGREELLGRDPRGFLFEDDLPEHDKKMSQRRQGQHDVYERRFRKKNGATLWTLVSATSVLGENGEFTGSFSMLQDITMRKAIEQKMTNSIARYALQRNCMAYISVSPLIRDGNIAEISREIDSLAAKALEVERVSVWLFDPQETKLSCIDLYESSKNNHSSGLTLNSAEYGNEFNYLKSAKYIDTDDPSSDPRTQGYTETYLKPNNITSMLDVVIRTSGKDYGLLCLEHVGQKHVWEEDEISFACQLADQIALTVGNRDRRQTEKALKDSEERYRILLELAPIGIAVHSEGKVVFTNPAGAKLIGYATPEEMIGTPITDYVHERSFEEAFSRLDRLLKGEKGLYPTEYYFRKRDGSPAPVEVTATLLKYNNKPSVQIIFSDISSRKKAEVEIRRNIERLTSIANILQYRTDSVQDFLDFALSEAVRLTESSIGFILNSERDAEGQYTMACVFKNGVNGSQQDDVKLMLSREGIWASTLRKGKPLIVNNYPKSQYAMPDLPQWHSRINNVISVPISGEGRIVAVIGVANKVEPYDNTDVLQVTLLMDSVWKMVENRRSQEQIRKLSRAVEQSPVSILITDTEGTIEYVNDFFCKITGYSFEEAVGKNPRILKSGKMPDSLYKELWETITSGRTWTGELLSRKASGELFWEAASITPVTDTEGRIINYLSVKEDISLQKEMTEELIKARDQAEETTRLKSSFLANMSHELRTPLVGIMGYSELLANLITDSEQKEMVMMINTSGKRLLHTLNMILDLSRIESNSQVIRHSTFELNSFIQDKVTLFKAAAQKKKLYLTFAPMEEPLFLYSDPHLLEHVVNDLINNAIKFTDTGGVNVYVELHQEIDGCRAVIRVKDTGIGIPQDRLQIIFDGFRQVSEGYNRNFGGSGLGLTISKKYTELLGGTITVSSELNVGSVFTVSFPEEYIRASENPLP
jgi:PAS domain S-box-containing protein